MTASEPLFSFWTLQDEEPWQGDWASGQAWRVWLFKPRTLLERERGKCKEDRWRDFLSRDRWLLHPEVLEKAEELEADGKRVTNFHFAGPAVLEVWYATYVQWGFAVFFPILVCMLSDCPRKEEPFAHYPKWVVIFFVPVLLYSLKCEFKALRYMICTMAQYCAPFTFFRWPLSFRGWLMGTFVVSLLTHADLATNGLFLAKILKTMGCHNSKTTTIQQIWSRAIENSYIVGWVPGFSRLDFLCLLVWALMFLQPTTCVLYGQPWPLRKSVSYEPESECKGYSTVWSQISQFWHTTVWSRVSQILHTPECKSDEAWVLHHADVLQWLATANRMVSLTDKSLAWTKARAMEVLESPDYVRPWDMVGREFARITHRLWLVNILEKACQIEVQTTIFAVSRYLIPRSSPLRVDGQMLISLIVSFITFTKVIYDHTCQLVLIWKCKTETEKQTPEQVEKDLSKKLAAEKGKLRSEHSRQMADASSTAVAMDNPHWVNTAVSFICGLLFLMVFLFHSLAKFVMAFVCEDSVWNIPLGDASGFDEWGCMQLAQFLPP